MTSVPFAPELPNLRFSNAFYSSVSLFKYCCSLPPLTNVLDASVVSPTLLLFFIMKFLTKVFRVGTHRLQV